MTPRERLREVKAGKKNVGGAERVIRGTLGPSLVLVGIADLVGMLTLAGGLLGTGIAVVLVIAGFRMTQTALTQRCYLNALIGRDSCRLDSESARSGREAEA